MPTGISPALPHEDRHGSSDQCFYFGTSRALSSGAWNRFVVEVNLEMWKLPLLWKEQGRRLSVRWITGAELGRRTSSSIRWGGRRPR
ncbi:uncharacterized protein LOC143353252 isoform X4 [Halictus rubicundus]|uniref:uncharacterized protein LOC143353252 isoform X4 n=1 Tax=Halictus rubicundus TaxID=77578 RepID=UPI004035803A